ncbi:unnamed protein product, partial [marine sediment metagenome]
GTPLKIVRKDEMSYVRVKNSWVYHILESQDGKTEGRDPLDK